MCSAVAGCCTGLADGERQVASGQRWVKVGQEGTCAPPYHFMTLNGKVTEDEALLVDTLLETGKVSTALKL